MESCVNTLEKCPVKHVKVFVGELGRCEKNGEDDKYILWYNAANKTTFATNVAWCAISASWALRRGGVDAKKYPNFASCTASLKVFDKKGLTRDPKKYTPKVGDLIYFDFNQDGLAEHVGIVYNYDGTNVETIEGNTSDSVRHKTYIGKSNKFIYKYVEVK